MAHSSKDVDSTGPLRAGDELAPGRLRIVNELGRGGMGIVYRARDEDLGRDVALKVLQEMRPEDVYWLKHEFRALHGISHPNLVRFYDLTTNEGGAFFTMELLDGEDLLTHARALPGADDGSHLASVLSVFRDLASGIDTLHVAGKIHRDIKPSNVFVTRAGRVVLLDFGLAVPRIPRDAPDTSRSFAGTIQYVAPEQMYGEATPAADWYSFGATLYEVLTSRVPFEGAFAEVVQAKTSRTPVEVEHHAPWVPADIARLVLELLRIDPAERPSGQAVLRTLNSRLSKVHITASSPLAASRDSAFLGRARELAELTAAAESLRDGPRVLHVSGPSGIGKSELVRQLVRGLTKGRLALVMSGRCHPQEFVPYKALDEAIDELGTFLSRQRGKPRWTLALDEAFALLRLFPTLARVPELGAALAAATNAPPANDAKAGVTPLSDQLDPQELRRRAFLALRRLLAQLAESYSVVLAIDDLQWGDLDSINLLDTVLSPPSAPPILVILSYRSEDIGTSPALQALFEPGRAVATESAHRVELGPLPTSEGIALARALLSGRSISDAAIEDMVRESKGSPLFVGELARTYGDATGAARPDTDGPLRVKDIIARRVNALSPEARRVLDVVSVAAKPILRPLAIEASGLPAGEVDHVLMLIDQSLLRGTTIGAAPGVAAYHDQVREAVVAAMSPDRRSDCHLRIARTIESHPAPDPATLAEHYLGAGDRVRAGRYAEEGADRAAQALAFDQAAELYRLAVSLPVADRRAARIKLAESLANAGRGAESGETYLVSADEAASEPPEQMIALELRRKAAEQFLHCGMILRGKEVMSSVLSSLDVTLPMTPGAATRAALWSRLRMILRGTRFQPKTEAEIPKPTLARLDALWGASTGLAMVDHVAADALGVRHLFEALEAGEPSRVVRCMGYEAAFEARLGGPLFSRRALGLMKRARSLAEETRDPYDRAWMDLCESSLRWFFLEWPAVIRASESALCGFRDQCRGKDWEIAVTSIFLLSALSYTGQLRRLAEQTRDAVRAARDRGDDFAANVYRMLPHLIWLAEDRPEHALNEADDAIKTWAVTGDFHLQHYHHAVATANAHLYAGEPWAAWRRLLTAWPGLTKASFLLLPAIGAEMAHVRARAALALLTAKAPTPPDLQEWTERRLRRTIAGDLKTIERTSFPLSEPFAASIRGGLAALAGNRREAELEWARAVVGFAGARMRLYQLAASYRLGEALGSGRGQDLMASSLDEIARLGAVRPERMVALIAPAS